MSFEWSEDLAVGHPVIDLQHRSLFEQFGKFVAACEEGRAPQQLQELFNFLDSYIEFHFHEEESLMERHAYQEVAQHRAEHAYFRRQVGDLRQELATAGATIQVLVLTNKALIYWLTEHIRQVDTRLAAFLCHNRQGKE